MTIEKGFASESNNPFYVSTAKPP